MQEFAIQGYLWLFLALVLVIDQLPYLHFDPTKPKEAWPVMARTVVLLIGACFAAWTGLLALGIYYGWIQLN